MLTSIQAQQLNRFGVANIDEQSGAFTQIIPMKYSKIIFHPSIIVAQNFDGTSDVYTPDGQLFFEHTYPIIQKYGIVLSAPDGLSYAYTFNREAVLERGYNILFLDNDQLLVSLKKNCYIYNYKTRKMVSAHGFKSILFFYGSQMQAKPYTPTLDVQQLLNNPDYLKYGAHLENLICVKAETGWGVIDATKRKIFSPFCYKVIVHCKGLNIGAIDNNGNEITLSRGNAI